MGIPIRPRFRPVASSARTQGYLQGESEFRVSRSTGNRDPNSYATRVSGNSMMPRLFDGDLVEVQTGNIAVILHENGQKWIKKVRIKRSVVVGEPWNSAESPVEWPANRQ